MRRRSICAFLAIALLAGSAQADLVPDGYKGVDLSIRVDAEVPAGKALILAHTFRAIDAIKPGVVAPVEWHPSAGKMVLMVVPAASLSDKVEEQRKALDREPLQQIEKSGKPCHEGFDGVRTVPISAPANEVRWNYKVIFADEGCTATLTRMEFFDKSGKAVDGTDVPGVPSAAAAPARTATAAANAAPSAAGTATGAPAAPASDPTAQVQKGGCGCEMGPGTSQEGALAGLLSAFGLLLAACRRKNGSPRFRAGRW
jgi:MYXO-CTERM domain-containing protein